LIALIMDIFAAIGMFFTLAVVVGGLWLTKICRELREDEENHK
jgi:hypothetical protein